MLWHAELAGRRADKVNRQSTNIWEGASVQNWDQIHLGDGWCSGDNTNLCVVLFLRLYWNLYVLSALKKINYRRVTTTLHNLPLMRTAAEEVTNQRQRVHMLRWLMRSSLNKPVQSFDSFFKPSFEQLRARTSFKSLSGCRVRND